MSELSQAQKDRLIGDLHAVSGVRNATVAETPTTVEVKVSLQEEAAISQVVQTIVQSRARILTLRKVEPTLEDVFVELRV